MLPGARQLACKSACLDSEFVISQCAHTDACDTGKLRTQRIIVDSTDLYDISENSDLLVTASMRSRAVELNIIRPSRCVSMSACVRKSFSFEHVTNPDRLCAMRDRYKALNVTNAIMPTCQMMAQVSDRAVSEAAVSSKSGLHLNNASVRIRQLECKSSKYTRWRKTRAMAT